MVKFLMVSVVPLFHILNLGNLVGFSMSMDEQKVVLTITVGLPLEMESSVAETASVVRLARRGGKTEAGIVCLMKETCQIFRKRRRLGGKRHSSHSPLK